MKLDLSIQKYKAKNILFNVCSAISRLYSYTSKTEQYITYLIVALSYGYFILKSNSVVGGIESVNAVTNKDLFFVHSFLFSIIISSLISFIFNFILLSLNSNYYPEDKMTQCSEQK